MWVRTALSVREIARARRNFRRRGRCGELVEAKVYRDCGAGREEAGDVARADARGMGGVVGGKRARKRFETNV
jgi:hypothetical protein